MINNNYFVLQSLYRTVPGIGVYFCTLHFMSHNFRYVYWYHLTLVIEPATFVYRLTNLL